MHALQMALLQGLVVNNYAVDDMIQSLKYIYVTITTK